MQVLTPDWSCEPAVRRRPEGKVLPVKEDAINEGCLMMKRKYLVPMYPSKVGVLRRTETLPSYIRQAMTENEMAEMGRIGEDLDDRAGDRSDVQRRLEVGGLGTKADECARCLELETMRPLPVLDVIWWCAAEKTRLRTRAEEAARQNRIPLPLPPCCDNPACRVCLRRSMLSTTSATSPAHVELYTVYSGWVRRTGKLAIEDAAAILKTYTNQTHDALPDTFAKVDAGNKKVLHFEEFCALCDDLGATNAIVQKRAKAYHSATTTTLETVTKQKKSDDDVIFTDEEISKYRHHYGAFDTSGDGLLDMDELRIALSELGHKNISDRWLAKMVCALPNRRSSRRSRQSLDDVGEETVIDFPQFLALMRQFKKAATEQTTVIEKSAVGPGALFAEARDLLRAEQKGVELPDGINQLRLKSNDVIELIILGTPTLKGTPYATSVLRLHIKASPEYPLRPPVAFFTRRLFHLNFSISLDGTTSIASALKHRWNASWNLTTLMTEVLRLLKEPDPSLLPKNLDRGTKYDPRRKNPKQLLVTPIGYDLRARRITDDVVADLAHLFNDNRDRYNDIAEAYADEFLEPYSLGAIDEQTGRLMD